jgi:hypothetical protein
MCLRRQGRKGALVCYLGYVLRVFGDSRCCAYLTSSTTKRRGGGMEWDS